MTTKKNVTISGEVHRGLSEKAREWSGFDDTVLVFGKPPGGVSDLASFDLSNHRMTVNPEPMVLNPNRVVLTFTPFRLRQEAVLTGAIMHEAAHARYTRWRPTSKEAFDEWTHRDGDKVSAATLALANLLEEPRIEARMAAESQTNGTQGLEWTMQAMAAHILPPTRLSADPNQHIMDLIGSYVLRAGRPLARTIHAPKGQRGTTLPSWAGTFRLVLVNALNEHARVNNISDSDISLALALLTEGLADKRDTGSTHTTHIDRAREILNLLFPAVPMDERPIPSTGGCSGAQGEETEGEGEEGEGEETEGEGPGEETEGEDSGATGSTEQSEEQASTQQQMQRLERAMLQEVAAEVKEERTKVPSVGAGGAEGTGAGGFRKPTASERETQGAAERFLRDLIDPSEDSKVRLSETPSAQVDGAALSAWRASGANTTPMFFRRTHREVTSAPPVKIAILVDVSSSMEVLQAPSALLSWALASAAFDMRNFAGRGRTIESCLIHWGSEARVIQPVGEALPGIREVECNEGTRTMGEALELVEQQMPGFLAPSAEPENRLLVQFTDWQLQATQGLDFATAQVHRALTAGVNMLSVYPDQAEAPSWAAVMDKLPGILQTAPTHRGKARLLRYDPKDPGAVWAEATKMLTEER